MKVQEAIETFCRAANQKGDFAEPASRDHALFEEMEHAWQVLKSHGSKGQEAFVALLGDESPHVRTWVASQLLALGDERGIPVLEASAEAGGIGGLDSEMVLREWRAGTLKPPLGTVDD